MLEVKNVSKKYNKKEVLSDVSINIKKGEIHGLIGENSAGKTTLIKCLVGIYKPDNGDILFEGESVYENSKAKERIGYVADYNEYINIYSINKIVKMFRNFYPNFSIERFDELNEIFKLNKKVTISNLSKGQKMRLAFMLSIAITPDYLILDEPTSGLDVISKKQLFEILTTEIENRDVGILISSHNLDGLETICDQITMVKDGRVNIQNDIDSVKSLYTVLQAVFEGGAPEKIFKYSKIIDSNNVGSIYKLVIRDFDDTVISDLKNMGATFVEKIDISLEDLFIYANKEEK